MAKIKSAKSGKENPRFNKAAVKAFIMAVFASTISDASAAGKPTPMDVATTNVTLGLILK